MKIKIINKSKEGVAIKTPKGLVKLSWKDFNAKYVIVDNFYVEPNEETKKKFKGVEDLSIQAYVIQKSINASKAAGGTGSPDDFLNLYSITEKIQKLMGFSNIIYAMNHLKEQFAIYDGLFKAPFKDNKRSIRQQELEEKKAAVKGEYNEIRSSNALGDVKGFDKLKEMFKDGEAKSE
jgi:hypothetical protein